ncbi:MAG: insulinase family protein [Saprospiraceae bacterium]|nr:insulinase family protein [Saprospiraceae bacterium]
MINYSRYVLKNGLTVILHQDVSTPLVVVNILYKVGSKNENKRHTGLAHLFEHLMFTGTRSVPDFDLPVQKAGGDNNAFTSNDITNYYSYATSANLDTLLYLEADRMHQLSLNPVEFDIQKKVVIEEFYETTLDEPYGDIWHLLGKLAFKRHPYRWPVIGLKPEDIKKTNLKDAAKFYHEHYYPSNAVLVVSGNFDIKKAKISILKHFGGIPDRPVNQKTYPKESAQRKQRRMTVSRNVQIPAIFMAFHIPSRTDSRFYATDILSDILANGRSARLHEILVKQKRLFSSIDAYTNGSSEEGLLVIDGKLSTGISPEIGENAIWEVLDDLKNNLIPERELTKVINKCITTLVFSEYSASNKAMNLAYFESLNNVNLINNEFETYKNISRNDIKRMANKIFRASNSNILYYLSTGKNVEDTMH